MPLISIVLPIYNVERYLRQTLYSIFSQPEAEECEVILINDGSTDHSFQIASEYAVTRSNIILINKDNEGVSSTRNLGIDKATGDYIFFIDADDILHPNALQIIFEGLKLLNPDILTWHYETFYSKPKFKSLPKSEIIRLLDGDNRTNFNWLMGKGVAVSVYNKVIRRELLDGIRFDTTLSYGEDMFFSWKCFQIAKNIAYYPGILYYYRQTGCSAVSRFHNNLYENYKAAFEDIAVFAEQHKLVTDLLLKDIDYHFACRLTALASMETRAPYPTKEKEARLLVIIQDKRIHRALWNDSRLNSSIYQLARRGKVRKMLFHTKLQHLKSRLLFPIKRLLK